jgi:uncharacterized protein (DUF362 family)
VFGRISRLYNTWRYSPLLVSLACLVWFLWRVGTKPSRIAYPCQQLALAQIVLYFGPAAVPLLGVYHRCLCYIRRREFARLSAVALIIIIATATSLSYSYFKENQLRAQGSGTIPMGPLAMSSYSASGAVVKSAGLAQLSCVEDPIVSVSYDPSISYGTTSPYDSQDNPAYDFVWDTVADLGLGSAANPIDDLINTGDTVLIKPNLVDYGPGVFTRPQVVRPLIDMAIAAGATVIYVGDGAENVSQTDDVINDAGYADMVSTLASRNPGITIETVNLNSLDNGWHWVSLGTDSSFAGSGYSHYDLSPGSGTLYGHPYYQAADPQGVVSPEGETLGRYAVSDIILDADVIINVPKMKTHQIMMATLSIKNLVGGTLSSTYDEETGDPQPRIAHCKTDREDNYFNNDIFWRAILDMNKVVLYADQDGVLQSTQQRQYLSVVDGIQAMERSQHHSYGGGGLPYDRHVIVVGIDPVATDAVASRLMGYDAAVIPSIGNADSDSIHPIGTGDPENIVVLGAEIDQKFCHVLEFNDAWEAYAGSLAITDFIPPAINSVTREGDVVTADISGGLVAYVFYEVGGAEQYQQMDKDGDTYSATLPEGATGHWVLAQDQYFNTTNSATDPHNLSSYSDSGHSLPCDDFANYSSQHTVFMYGTNFIPNHDYRLVYYDGSDNKVATDDQTSDGSGIIASQHTFKETDPADQPGNWHVMVCEAEYTAPLTYDDIWPCTQISDSFSVQQSAIPEFPTAFAVIAALALSAIAYLFMRRKAGRSTGLISPHRSVRNSNLGSSP